MVSLVKGGDCNYSLWLKNEFIDFCKLSIVKSDEYINNNQDIEFISNHDFIRSPEVNIVTSNFVIKVLKNTGYLKHYLWMKIKY